MTQDAKESLPYPGLRPYRRDEAHLFFGREGAVGLMLERLRRQRLLAVTGPSGCGKSSLVRAGLLHELDLGSLGQEYEGWRIVEFRPGGRPLRAIARALTLEFTPELLQGSSEGLEGIDRALLVQARLERNPNGLTEWLKELHSPPRECILILVDQFEEVFRFESKQSSAESLLTQRDEVDRFVRLLLATVATNSLSKVFVCLTVRLDFLGDCAQFPGLAESISDGQFLVPRLSRTDIEQAVRAPARVFGGDVEEELVTRLANDMALEDYLHLRDSRSNPDVLPLLQHVLSQLWQTQIRAGSKTPKLTHPAYVAMGGLRGSLSAHMDNLYASLSPRLQEVAEHMFKALAQPSGGDASRDVRRPISVGEAIETTACTLDELQQVLETFSGEGRNFLHVEGNAPLESRDMIDITHEALIRQWDRLQGWVREEEAAGREYAMLERQAGAWQDDRADLLTGRAALTAWDWWNVRNRTAGWARRYGGNFELTKKFVIDSMEHENKAHLARRRLRRNIIASGIAVLVGVCTWLVYDYSNGQARAQLQATEARLVTRIARERLEQEDPTTATLLAREVSSPDTGGLGNRPYSARAEAVLYAGLRALRGRLLLRSGAANAVRSDLDTGFQAALFGQNEGDNRLLLWKRRMLLLDVPVPDGAGTVLALNVMQKMGAIKSKTLDQESLIASGVAPELLVASAGTAYILLAQVSMLPAQTLSVKRAMLTRQTDSPLRRAEIDSTGELLVLLSGSGTLEFYNLRSREILYASEPKPMRAEPLHLTFVTGPNGDQPRLSGDANRSYTAVRFFNRGRLRLLALGDERGMVTVWSLGTATEVGITLKLEEVKSFEPAGEPVSAIAASDDGAYLFVGGLGGRVIRWSLSAQDTQQPLTIVPLGDAEQPVAIGAMEFDKRNGSLLAAGAARAAQITYVDSHPSVGYTWRDLRNSRTVDLAPSADGRPETDPPTIVANVDGGLAIVYPEDDSSTVQKSFKAKTGSSAFNGHEHKLDVSIALEDANQWIFEEWNTSGPTETFALEHGPQIETVPYAVLSGDGSSAFVAPGGLGSTRGKNYCLATTSGQKVELKLFDADWSTARLSSDGARVYFVAPDGEIRAWNCRSGIPLWHLRVGGKSTDFDILPAPSGDIVGIFEASANRTWMISGSSGLPATKKPLPGRIVAFSKDSTAAVMLVDRERGRVTRADLSTTESEIVIDGDLDSLSPPDIEVDDQAAVIVIHNGSTAQLWRRGTRKRLRLTFPQNDAPKVSEAVWSPSISSSTRAKAETSYEMHDAALRFRPQHDSSGADLASDGSSVLIFNQQQVAVGKRSSAGYTLQTWATDFSTNQAIIGARFSADGHSIITVHRTGISRWTLGGSLMESIPTQICEAEYIVRVPRSARLVVYCKENRVQIIDVSERLQLIYDSWADLREEHRNNETLPAVAGSSSFRDGTRWLRVGQASINLEAIPFERKSNPIERKSKQRVTYSSDEWTVRTGSRLSVYVNQASESFVHDSKSGQLWSLDGKRSCRVVDAVVAGDRVALLQSDSTVTLWSVPIINDHGTSLGEPRKRLLPMQSFTVPFGVTWMVESYDGRWLALSDYFSLWVVDLQANAPIQVRQIFEPAADDLVEQSGASFSATNSNFAIQRLDGSVLVFEVPSWRIRTRISAPAAGLTILKAFGNQFAGDTNRFIRMTSERTIEIIDLDNNRPIVQIPSVDQDVIRYRLSPNGEFLIVGYDNGTIRLWQIATAVMLDVYAAGADIVDVGGWDSHSVSVLTREGMVLERFPTLEFEKPLSTPPHLLGDNPRERIERIIGQRTLTDDERHKYLD